MECAISTSNNRMQTDFDNRYAIASAADAKRYGAFIYE